MKKGISQAIILIAVMFMTVGCVSSRQESGALTGAAVGAVLGSTVGKGRNRYFSTWLGAVIGASIGSTIGRYMDEQDRMKTIDILETRRTNTATTWVNPDTRNSYTMTPTRTYSSGEGPCREFTLDAQIGGNTEQVYGTACRQADGSWKILK